VNERAIENVGIDLRTTYLSLASRDDKLIPRIVLNEAGQAVLGLPADRSQSDSGGSLSPMSKHLPAALRTKSKVPGVSGGVADEAVSVG
jgi:hypothetical protein